jgi:hypothetical protein
VRRGGWRLRVGVRIESDTQILRESGAIALGLVICTRLKAFEAFVRGSRLLAVTRQQIGHKTAKGMEGTIVSGLYRAARGAS